jgi:hypothetical protein
MLWKRKLVVVAVCLFVLGVQSHLSSADAFAQVRPAYTKNVDEPGRIPYDNNVVSVGGGFGTPLSSVVTSNFPAVPAGKRLVIEHISVYADTFGLANPAPSVSFIAFPTPSGNSADGYKFVVEPSFFHVDSGFYLDRPIKVYYEPLSTPRVSMFSFSGLFSYVNVTLHGYLIDAVN